MTGPSLFALRVLMVALLATRVMLGALPGHIARSRLQAQAISMMCTS